MGLQELAKLKGYEMLDGAMATRDSEVLWSLRVS